jgi:hypothetical protein
MKTGQGYSLIDKRHLLCRQPGKQIIQTLDIQGRKKPPHYGPLSHNRRGGSPSGDEMKWIHTGSVKGENPIQSFLDDDDDNREHQL